jgi:Pyrimidine dimer DNA glycosylase
MNVFFLHTDPVIAAQSMCNEHQKMILESAQILSTVHNVYGSKFADQLYKPTHRNHPSVLWAIESTSNYEWLYAHFIALADEMYRRNGVKYHKSATTLGKLLAKPPRKQPDLELTLPKVAARPEYQLLVPKKLTDVVIAYRHYYVVAKQFATWKNSFPPDWFLCARAALGSLPVLLKRGIGFQPFNPPKPPDVLYSGLALQNLKTYDPFCSYMLDS